MTPSYPRATLPAAFVGFARGRPTGTSSSPRLWADSLGGVKLAADTEDADNVIAFPFVQQAA